MKTKRKKLAQLDEVIVRLGLTKKEVVEHLMLSLESDNQFTKETVLSDDKQEIYLNIKEYLEESLSYQEGLLTPKSCVKEVDSLELVELVMHLEVMYSIDIKEEIIEKWKTVEDVVETVYLLINENKKQLRA